MRCQCLVMAGGMALAMSLAQGHVTGQTQSAAANAKTAAAGKTWTPSRTPDGQPDLQGVWANNNATPLERPKELAGREFLTDAEVATLKAKAAALFGGDGDAAFGDTIFQTVLAGAQRSQPAGPHKKAAGEFDEGTGDYNSVWIVSREWNNRTSLIVDPRDGKLPPMTPEGQERQRITAAARQGPAAGPEDRSLSERCITFGSPRLQAGYNSYFQIFQTSHYYEYACHEGNSGMVGILAGARAEEKAAEGLGKPGSK